MSRTIPLSDEFLADDEPLDDYPEPICCEACGLETAEDDLDDNGICSTCRMDDPEADLQHFRFITR